MHRCLSLQRRPGPPRIGRDSAEFAVGIRSGFVEGKIISLFAGAGIVGASKAEMEWEETENKLRQFTDVIGG